MSKIIKAAKLKVLVTDDADTIIPAISVEEKSPHNSSETILDASNLLEDAQKQADQILIKAKEEAELRLTEATEEFETLRLKIKEEGYAQGYKEGFIDGQEKALEQAAKFLETLENTVQESVKIRATNLAALEDDFLKLSLLLADKILRRAVAEDISWLEPVIQNAIQSLGSVDKITVYVSAMDYSLIKEHEEQLYGQSRTKISFEQDLSIAQGGCIIESESGFIDARLERRLGKLAKGLMEVLYDEHD